MLLAHNVFFKLKENSPAAVQKLIADCKKYLTVQKGIVSFCCGKIRPDLAREVNDRDWDVGLHIVFTIDGARVLIRMTRCTRSLSTRTSRAGRKSACSILWWKRCNRSETCNDSNPVLAFHAITFSRARQMGTAWANYRHIVNRNHWASRHLHSQSAWHKDCSISLHRLKLSTNDRRRKARSGYVLPALEGVNLVGTWREHLSLLRGRVSSQNRRHQHTGYQDPWR